MCQRPSEHAIIPWTELETNQTLGVLLLSTALLQHSAWELFSRQEAHFPSIFLRNRDDLLVQIVGFDIHWKEKKIVSKPMYQESHYEFIGLAPARSTEFVLCGMKLCMNVAKQRFICV